MPWTQADNHPAAVGTANLRYQWIVFANAERLQQLLSTRARDENLSIDDVRAERMQAEGIRRLGQPEDTAALVAFLCGDEARHIHGAGIAVDGGATKGYF